MPAARKGAGTVDGPGALLGFGRVGGADLGDKDTPLGELLAVAPKFAEVGGAVRGPVAQVGIGDDLVGGEGPLGGVEDKQQVEEALSGLVKWRVGRPVIRLPPAFGHGSSPQHGARLPSGRP